MIGSIIGDIVGSIYEFSNIRTKDFEFFGRYVEYTDDSIDVGYSGCDYGRTPFTGGGLLCPVCGSLSLSDGRIWKLFRELGHPGRQEPDMLRHTTAAATDRPCV